MTFITVLALFVTSLALAVLWSQRYGGYMPEPYRSRPCQGFVWRRVFPSSSDEKIREFLRLFVGAFAYRDRQMLQVEPEDKIIDVYRAQYPQTGGVDGLELETLAAMTEKKYKIDFSAIWAESLTFGALFSACQDASIAKTAEYERTN